MNQEDLEVDVETISTSDVDIESISSADVDIEEISNDSTSDFQAFIHLSLLQNEEKIKYPSSSSSASESNCEVTKKSWASEEKNNTKMEKRKCEKKRIFRRRVIPKHLQEFHLPKFLKRLHRERKIQRNKVRFHTHFSSLSLAYHLFLD